MKGIKRNPEIGDPDSDLLTDLVAAVKAQHKKDGTGCTPFGSDTELREVLTERWAGTKITATVAEGGQASITQTGVYDDTPGRWGEWTGRLVKFSEAEGEIESVSPGYGGYIALTNGRQITFPNRGETRPLPERKLGLGIEEVAA